MSPTIYNATDGPLAIDRAGRMIAAGETRPDVEDVDGSPLAGHISADRIIVVDASPADDADASPEDEGTPTTTTRTRKGARTQED